MKKLILVLPLVVVLTGCGKFSNILRHEESDWFGLNRTITLYNANGTAIQTWKAKSKVEDRGGSCYFIDSNSKAVIISGTFIIQEN